MNVVNSMAIRKVLETPDKRLRIKAKPVETFDAEFQLLVADMFETMYDEKGVGLAATQINVHQRVVVIDVSDDKSQRLCIVNPEIINSSGKIDMHEGCLSVPEAYAPVTRAEFVKIRAVDQHGKPFELEADGLLARCILHEIDHINGILFIDHLSALKRQMVLRRLMKLKKHAGNAA